MEHLQRQGTRFILHTDSCSPLSIHFLYDAEQLLMHDFSLFSDECVILSPHDCGLLFFDGNELFSSHEKNIITMAENTSGIFIFSEPFQIAPVTLQILSVRKKDG